MLLVVCPGQKLLKLLAAELGVRLINRATRHLSLTEAGETFHRHGLAVSYCN